MIVFLAYFVFLGSTLSHASFISNPDVSCDGVNDRSYIPNLEDCSKYFQCIGNEAFLISCPRGLFFNTVSNLCTSYEEANCEASSPTPPSTTSSPTVSCEGVPNNRFISSPLSCYVSDKKDKNQNLFSFLSEFLSMRKRRRFFASMSLLSIFRRVSSDL